MSKTTREVHRRQHICPSIAPSRSVGKLTSSFSYAFVIVPDHGQAVMAHALRGRGDTWVPVATHMISYFGIMAPLSWILTLTLARGTGGIMEAMLIASVVAALFLFGRFYLLSKRPLA